jgi:hypothetical protein
MVIFFVIIHYCAKSLGTEVMRSGRWPTQQSNILYQ